MENSRQNTRFRWRDAKKMESFIGKVEETEEGKIEVKDPVVMDEDVSFEGKIIDKNGQEVLAGGGGSAEVIELEINDYVTDEQLAKITTGTLVKIGEYSVEGSITVYCFVRLTAETATDYYLGGYFIEYTSGDEIQFNVATYKINKTTKQITIYYNGFVTLAEH